LLRCSFGYDNHQSSGWIVPAIKCTPALDGSGMGDQCQKCRINPLIFNNTRTEVIEHQAHEGSWSSWL
jgi:hypothetical protein